MKYGTRRHDILCLSSQRWDEVMWTNKQHIMSRLAREHRVVHVDHGTMPLWQYLRARWEKRPFDLFSPLAALRHGVVKRGPSLWVGQSWAPAPAMSRVWPDVWRDYIHHGFKARVVRQSYELPGFDPVVWVYHPLMADVALAQRDRKLLVYDCVDDYAAFPEMREHPTLAAREERLCREADLVITTSQRLFEIKRELNPENTYLVENVGDAEHFNKAMASSTIIPDELVAIRALGPVVGFVGAVSNYKLDLDWIMALAEAKPETQIVLIGPVGIADPSTDVGKVSAMPNVHLLGAKDYSTLPSYIKGFDVTVIPYRINQYTESVFPIKFFEFLATGKPVVISALPALAKFYDRVHVARDAREFVDACERGLAGDGVSAVEERLALATEHSWPRRIGKIMELIEARLPELGER